MGRCASHGYFAGDLCDVCYPLRNCESCASLRAEVARLELDLEICIEERNARDDAIMTKSNTLSALRTRIAALERFVEAIKSTRINSDMATFIGEAMRELEG